MFLSLSVIRFKKKKHQNLHILMCFAHIHITPLFIRNITTSKCVLICTHNYVILIIHRLINTTTQIIT